MANIMRNGSGTGSSILRWSLRSLARCGDSKESARLLTVDLTNRLARQLKACTDLVDHVVFVVSSSTHSSTTTPHHQEERHYRQKQQQQQQQQQQQALKNLKHLHYVHKDTYRLCQQASQHDVAFDRWSDADQHWLKKTMEQIQSRHALSLERWVDVVVDIGDLEEPVLNILAARNGIQLLCDHYIMLHKGRPTGRVSLDCPVWDCLQDATVEAKMLCEAHLLKSPEVGHVINDMSCTVPIVRPWLHHSLVEILKNAMAASVKNADAHEPPPIQIEVTMEDDHVVIDVLDDGPGLPQVEKANGVSSDWFGLGTSSAHKRWDRLDEQQSYAAVRSPLSSLGVGLPTSRLLMQHFGGNVQLEPRQDGSTGCRARILVPAKDDIPERTPFDDDAN